MLAKKNKLPIQYLKGKKPEVKRSQSLTLKKYTNNKNLPRVGVMVSKKVVKSAVERNKLKRLIFNQVRLSFFQLEAVDYLIMISKNSSKEQLIEELNKLLK